MLESWIHHTRRIRHQLGQRVQFGGSRFKFHGYHAARMIDSASRHEPYLIPVIERLLKAHPGTFLDVGVNVGQTLAKVLSIDCDRKYIGFEPQIACCYEVHRFASLNQLHNVLVMPIALSDANGVASFFSSSQFDEKAAMRRDACTKSRVVMESHVVTRIGDEVLTELKVDNPCAIKIDVEGAELLVIRGLQRTLESKRPPVVFEVLPNFFGVKERTLVSDEECTNRRRDADEIFRIFANVGYDIYQIDAQGGETKILRFDLDDQVRYVGRDYIARPR